MKKVFLIAVLSFSLIGCGNNNESSQTEHEKKVEKANARLSPDHVQTLDEIKKNF